MKHKLILFSLILMITGFSRQQSMPGEDIVFDNFRMIKGLEYTYVRKTGSPGMVRLMQLGEGLKIGWAEDYFFDQSGKYDLTLHYFDGSKGKSSVEVRINNHSAGGILLGNTNSFKEQTIKDINIQQWSKIELEFKSDGKEYCRVEKLVFSPVGAFEGKSVKLQKPVSLQVFETASGKSWGRHMLTDFVSIRIDSLMEKRDKELKELKNHEDLSARQKEIRKRLPEIFGEFPEKTPLNARITGKLDRDEYTIEKVIFESQPKYYVSANLYIPKKRNFPLPGIVFTCGHSDNGKAQTFYHETCLGMVLKGYVVLAFDPQGQGERSEYFREEDKKNIISLGTGQHMYLGRPSFLVDWSLAGLRVWDGIRATDYLISRPEVDKYKLGVVGNSGGGQMAFLIAAADERIKVCVAAHPGGPMENRYLKGFGVGSQSLIDREIMSLIPPRPCRIVVGWDSGEEPRHRAIYEDMQLFYEGFGYKERIDFALVDGVHDMRQPKREATYEWLNKWFGKEEEGTEEPALKPEDEKDLWCTESGFTLISLGGETGQSLNVKRLQSIYKPSKNSKKLKEQIARRIGLAIPESNKNLKVQSFGEFNYENIIVEKFTYESEMDILIPSSLYKPNKLQPDSPIYLYVSDKGKPVSFDQHNLPFKIAQDGYIAMAIDVRGVGETSPTPPLVVSHSGFSEDNPPNAPLQYRLRYEHENLAIQSTSFDRTMAGMRTLDVLKGIEFIKSREELKGRRIILIGEGSAGLWTLLAAYFDNSVYGLVNTGTLPSLKLLITNQYYNVWDYFWLPGVLRDFDMPDIVRAISPRQQIWIDPVDVLGEKLQYPDAKSIIGSSKNIQIITTDNRNDRNNLEIIKSVFKP